VAKRCAAFGDKCNELNRRRIPEGDACKCEVGTVRAITLTTSK
jgi:hypothetical protein